MSILSDRTGEAKFAEGVLPYVIAVGLVAAVIIVLFSVASISLLHTRKETLTGSRIEHSPVEDKFIGRVVSYIDSNTAPDPVQTKSPSSSEVNNLPSSTPIPPPSGMSGEETVPELALKPTSDREGSAAAVEIPQGSTRGPSTDEMTPPELSGSQEVIAQPASIAEPASAAQNASGATALTPEIRFPEEPQVKESPKSDPPLHHAASRGRGAVKADRYNTANELNHAELSRLVRGGGALRRAPLR
jgi:hypothetical protein